MIDDIQKKCHSCAKPISKFWFMHYCNVACVPDDVEVPRNLLQEEALRIDRAKCQMPLSDREALDLLAFLRQQPPGADFGQPVILVSREKIELSRALAGGKLLGAPESEPDPFMKLTAGDIIENLLVLLTEAEYDYNNLVQGVHDMHDRRMRVRRRQNLLQGGAR